MLLRKTHIVKTSNVHKLAWYIFYKNGAFVRVLESYLLRSASAVPIQKLWFKIIHSRYIVGKTVTGMIKDPC